jgi:hypothetical protein
VSYHISNSQYNWQKSTCLDFESELHWCTTADSSYLIWCDTVLYKQNIVIRQSENDHCLRKVSIWSKLLLINLENRIDINICTDKSSNISIVQDKNSTCCQLQDTYLYDIYIMIVVDVVVAAELVVQESVLKCVNQERFHIWEMRVKKLKKKEKRFEKKMKIYNSLHWGVSWSELLSELYKKKIMCWQAIRTLSANLICIKQTNTC